MSEEDRTVAGKRYTYTRVVAEILSCETCQATFVTQVDTGRGALMTPSDESELCPACLEMCANLAITERDGSKPS